MHARSSTASPWVSLHLPCNVHKVAGVFSKTFDMMQSDISGMINFSLYLGTGAQMHRFRKGLVDLVSQKLVILRGPPDPACEEYRSFVIGLLCNTGRKRDVRRYLLQTLLNGNWKNREAIEIHVAPDTDVSRDQLVQRVSAALLVSLAGVLFHVYPRHRWLGADLTVDQIALLEAVHGVGGEVLRKLQASTTSLEGESPVPIEMQTEEPVSIQPISGVGSEQFFLPSAGHSRADAQVLAPQEAPPSGAGPVLGPDLQDPHFHSIENSKRMQRAHQWMASKPLPRLLATRMCMKPLAALLEKHMERSGHQWHLEEKAKAAEGVLAATPDHFPDSTPLIEYLRLRAETQFFEELAQVCTSSSWQHIDESSYTIAFEGLLFRLLSRMGALVHESLVKPVHQFPLQTFQTPDECCRGGR